MGIQFSVLSTASTMRPSQSRIWCSSCGIMPVPRQLPSMPCIIKSNLWWSRRIFLVVIKYSSLIKEIKTRTRVRIEKSVEVIGIIPRGRLPGRCLRDINVIRQWLRRSWPWRGWFQQNQGIRVLTFALVFRLWSRWRCLIKHMSPRWCRPEGHTPIIPILIVFWRNVILTLCVDWRNRSISGTMHIWTFQE